LASAIIVIPTYNEQANIASMINTIMALPDQFDLLVIDDNSPDGTAQEVELLIKQFPERLFLHKRSGKLGLGTAYIEGFKWALQHPYEFVIEMDADFSHDPNDLPRLLNACREGADVAIGSRYVKDGTVVNWPVNRVLLSKGASLYVRMITWMPVKDATAGFVCYRRKVLETIRLDDIKFIGYAFQIGLKYAAWKCGFKIKEIPIVFKDREKGISKMSKGIFREAVYGVVKMRWKSMFSSYRNKSQL